MPNGGSLKSILASAREEEKRCDWFGAIKLYDKASHYAVIQADSWKLGELEERVGFCFYRASMQAESRDKFRESLQRAIKSYGKALEHYEKLRNDRAVGCRFRCRAVSKYLEYWFTSDPSEGRKLLDDCLEFEGQALDSFWKSRNITDYCRTYSELSITYWLRIKLTWERQILERTIEKGIKWGERALEMLSELEDPSQTAWIYFTLANCLYYLGAYLIAEPEEIEKNRLKIVEYMNKATPFAEKAADLYLLGLLSLMLGENTQGEEAVSYYNKALEYGKLTRDNLLLSLGFDTLAYTTYWEANATEDPDKRKDLAEKAIRFHETAQHHGSILSFLTSGSFISHPAGHAEHYFESARWETDLDKKRQLLDKSLKAGMEALKTAELSDIPLVIAIVLHVLSKTLRAKALVESDPEEKNRLLRKALEYREKTLEICKQLTPFDYFSVGIMQNGLADTKAELALTEPDLEIRKRVLEEAALGKKKSLESCNRSIPYYVKQGNITLFATVQRIQDSYATLLTRLFDLTNSPDYLREAIEVQRESIESASKVDMVNAIAEYYWKTAKVQDVLGEYQEAAENFKTSSANYIKAARKIPRLKDLYQDYASYMLAWSEIERAKGLHEEKRYELAKERYKKAADFHRSTERWAYLSQNYLAWARLEEAEDLSRKAQSEKAKSLFQLAASLFTEAGKSIKTQVEKIEVTDERQMATELLQALQVRRQYCLGRIALEEARILERRGDPLSSSKKYRSAAETLEKIAQYQPIQSRKELQPIICLSLAWEKMMQAEAKASPTLYSEAAGLFEQAKEHAPDPQTALLALANSSFCKALEAGTEFEISRDVAKYSTAKRHLEAAANYYLKAGSKEGSDYARASQRLLDAYVYMDKAQTETDPSKKARLYQIAERLLQTSVGSYLRASYLEKSEEVKRILGRVKEEKQLATSLSEVLTVPSTASTTSAFATPTPTHEKAVGFESFEHAFIQAYLTATETANVEEDLQVRLDVVNVAKNAGLLVRVDGLVPSGFEAIALPSQYNLENGSLDMKGKKLEPLKTESIKLFLRTSEACNVNLSPHVIYVDETGNFRDCRPKPAAISVYSKLAFEFKTKATQSVFDFLTSCFEEDYMRRRISVESSGWRSLMQIVKHGRVPKSSVYGDGGRLGPTISELERRGLIEARIFPGERGRGGRILKVRISYEKETVRRYVDQRVTKIRKNR